MLATWQSITVEPHEKYEICTEVFIPFVTGPKSCYAFEGATRYELWAKKVLTALKIGLETVPHI